MPAASIIQPQADTFIQMPEHIELEVQEVVIESTPVVSNTTYVTETSNTEEQTIHSDLANADKMTSPFKSNLDEFNAKSKKGFDFIIISSSLKGRLYFI